MDGADDAREVKRLRRFLTRPGPRFGLALGLYADARRARGVRQQLEAAVVDAGKRSAILELGFDDASEDLVARMIEAGEGADALHVVGLDGLVVDGLGQLRQTSALANLNQRRDELPNVLDMRVVFWLAHDHYPELTEVAWDLVQVMLTTAEFHEVDAVALSAEAFADLDEEAADDDELAAPTDDERKALQAQLGSLDKVLERARRRFEDSRPHRSAGPAESAAGGSSLRPPSAAPPARAPVAKGPPLATKPAQLAPGGPSPVPALRPSATPAQPPPAAAPAPAEPPRMRAAVPESFSDAASFADAATSAGELATRLGEVERGTQLLTEAAEAWVEVGDVLEAVRQLRRVAELHLERGELDDALAALARGQALFSASKAVDEAVNDSWWDVAAEQGHLFLLRAEAMIRSQDYASARAELDEALDRFEQAGDQRGCAQVFDKLALISEQSGELDAAIELRRDLELPAYLGVGDEEGAARTRTRIAELLAQVGELAPALEMIREEVLPAARGFADRKPAQQALSALAVVLDARGEHAAAAQVRRDELGQRPLSPVEPDTPKPDDREPTPDPDPDGSEANDEHINVLWWLVAGAVFLLALILVGSWLS